MSDIGKIFNYIYQMETYVITKSMNRDERCALIMKLYHELFDNGKFDKVFDEQENEIKAKKKSRLYGNKKIDSVHSIANIKHKGIDVFNVMAENKGIDIIFNTSPIDAPYVEYIRVPPSKTPIIYSQHLLSRYNERAYNNEYQNFKSIIIALHVKNPIKSSLAIEENGEIIQRIKEGFLLGRNYDKYIVFNTFYDNQESYDNDIKNSARLAKTKSDSLTPKQVELRDTLQFQYANGAISNEDFNYLLQLNGLV